MILKPNSCCQLNVVKVRNSTNFTVSRVYDDMNIKRRKYTEQDKQHIVQLYQQGKTCEDIALDLGIPCGSLFKIIKSSGVDLRPRKRRKLQYSIDETFFNDETNWGDEKCWVWGFMMADAHHNVKGHRIVISLAEQDVEIL